MQKTLLSTFFLMLTSSLASIAQHNQGARLTAMGNSSAAVFDTWSVNANPSGITHEKKTIGALNYKKFNFGDELSEQSFAFVAPINHNFLAVSVNRYGISEFNEVKAGVALAKRFGDELSIGLKANFHQIKITNYGNTNTFSVDVGANYAISGEINFGLYVNNPTGQDYKSTSVAAEIPSAVHFGATYEPSNKVILSTTISKDFARKFDVGVGVDYKFYDFLSLRGGLTAQPFKQYFGFGLNFQHLKFDLSSESHPQIGFTPQMGLSYAF